MIGRGLLLMAILLFGTARGSAENSYPSQISKDGLIKITLLYVGANHNKTFWEPFVVIYLLEDRRPKEDIQRNLLPIQNWARVYPEGSTFVYGPPTGANGSENYETVQTLYSLTNLPQPDKSYSTTVYQDLYKWAPKGPLEVMFLRLNGRTPEITFDHILPTE
jgi:hypothetical protein